MPTVSQAAIEEKIRAWVELLQVQHQAHPQEELAIVGIIRHGEVLARRLQQGLKEKGLNVRYGALDISLYRDDFDMRSCKLPLRSSYLPFSTDGLQLVLVDDVIHTGRTIRAALNAIFEYGRPARVFLHCLVDHGGRQLPIQPDFAAFDMSDTPNEIVVRLQEIDACEEISY